MNRSFPLLLAFLAPPMLAAHVAEKPLTIEAPLEGKGAITIESLLGSIELIGGGKAGTVRIEGRVLAEAATLDEAQGLADSVTIERRAVAGASHVHVVFPLDRHEAFYPPREADRAGRTVAGWMDALAALVRDSTVTYDEKQVTIGRSRGAAGLAVHLVVTVPDGISSTLDLAAGPVKVGRVRGAVLASVERGRLIAEQVYGALELRSLAGDVTLRTFRGESLKVRAGTGMVGAVDVDAGAVELRMGEGGAEVSKLTTKSLTVENGSGEVFLNGVEAARYDIATGSGDVTLLTNLDRAETGVVRADSGNVMIRLGNYAPFRMEIVTEKGSIRAEGKAVHVERREPTSVIAERGKGGSTIRVETRSGDVSVAPR